MPPMPTNESGRTELTMRELCERAIPGPYFVSHDDKDPGEDYHAHIGSGLAVVDTGRSGDWPVARFCEWPTAQLIARCPPSVMLAVVEALEEAKRTHYYCEDSFYSCPKHPEGCGDDNAGIDCNCGADAVNTVIDRALSLLNTPGT